MKADPDSPQRHALGTFLRAQRERQRPRDFGIAEGPRRRTPGLRREELAQLCGISATWLTWIEQGRDVAASTPALARLARGLGLSVAERAYLFHLAGRHDPEEAQDSPSTAEVETIARSLQGMRDPAYLLDRFWFVRAWNPAAQYLFAGWLDQPGEHHLLRFVFLDPAARDLIVDWEGRARRLLAEFRADASRHPRDDGLHALIAELSRDSQLFVQTWAAQTVLGRDGGERRFNHPIDGALRYEQLTFTLARNADLKLVMLMRT